MQAENLFDWYPDSPGWKRTDTSEAAAESIKPKAETIRGLVLNHLRDYDMTTDEMAARLDLDKLSVRPRFSELREMGLVHDTGRRRKNLSGKSAIVWGLT